MTRKALLLFFCLGIALVSFSRTASAQLDFQVSLNTSGLNPASTFYAEFSLSDGQAASMNPADMNNSALLSSFTFGGGAAGAVLPPIIGNASGDMTTSISMIDGDPTSDLAQAFTPGSALTFNVHLTTNVDAGPTPDEFLFRLLDSTQAEIPTNDPSGNNGFVIVDLSSPTLRLADVQRFGSVSGLIPPPTISPLATAPEPGALSLLMGGGVCSSLLALARKRRGRGH